jgi:hypothetical protein
VYIDTITREGSEIEFLVKDGDYYPSSYQKANEIKFVPALISWIPLSTTYRLLRSWTILQKRIFQNIVFNHGIGNARLLDRIVAKIDDIEGMPPIPEIEEDLRLDLEFPDDEDHLHGDLDIDDLLDLASEQGGYSSSEPDWQFGDDSPASYGSEPSDESFGYEDLDFESRDIRRTGDVFDDDY